MPVVVNCCQWCRLYSTSVSRAGSGYIWSFVSVAIYFSRLWQSWLTFVGQTNRDFSLSVVLVPVIFFACRACFLVKFCRSCQLQLIFSRIGQVEISRVCRMWLIFVSLASYNSIFLVASSVVSFGPSCRTRLASVGRAGCLFTFLDRSGSRLIVAVSTGCGYFLFVVPVTVEFFWSYWSWLISIVKSLMINVLQVAIIIFGRLNPKNFVFALKTG